MRSLSLAFAAVALIAAPAFAAPACKDAKGKFIKCPPAAAPTVKPAAKPVAKSAKAAATAKSAGRCRNAKGQFAKCGTPGAKPA